MSNTLTNAPARPALSWLRTLFRRPAPPPDITPGALPHLTDRTARDIGLNATETELLRLQWPSSSGPRHPML